MERIEDEAGKAPLLLRRCHRWQDLCPLALIDPLPFNFNQARDQWLQLVWRPAFSGLDVSGAAVFRPDSIVLHRLKCSFKRGFFWSSTEN